MAILLVITVFLPLVGSLVLFAVAPARRRGRPAAIALGVGAGDAGAQPGPARRVSSRACSSPQFAFGQAGGPYGLAWLRSGPASGSRSGSTGSASGSSP